MCASENNLVVNNAFSDSGDCLFASVAYQLKANNVCSANVYKLRQMTASYLETHGDIYSQFIAESRASSNPFNADTEAPDDEDAQIDQIADPHVQLLARWTRYLHRLRNGAWGDNLCIAAMANMFSVTVNVYSATDCRCTVTVVTPSEG